MGLFIVWSDKYATGIPILDEQLRGLVSLVNCFYFHRADADKDIELVLVPTAEMFKSYARLHFYTIEKLMVLSEYPEMEKYVKRHRAVMGSILRMDLICRGKRDAQQLLDFLKDYWLSAVRELSAEYIEHLRCYYSPNCKQFL